MTSPTQGKVTFALTLLTGQKADPETCGACRYFRRETSDPMYKHVSRQGDCTLKLPPQIARTPWNGESKHPSVTSDTDTCSFFRDWPSGTEIITSSKRVVE